MLKAKAYCHWYEAEGMDIDSFHEAQNNLRDLISEYQQYQEMGISGEESEEEGEDLESSLKDFKN